MTGARVSERLWLLSILTFAGLMTGFVFIPALGAVIWRFAQ